MTEQKNAVNSAETNRTGQKGLHFTREELIQLHWVQGLSLVDIGKVYGVTGRSIWYWCKKLGVQHRAQLQDVLFEASPALSYVFGVLHGDGFLAYNVANNHHDILLSVTDVEFANSFARGLHHLGLRAGVILLKQRPPAKQQWKTYATSKRFHELWNGMTKEQRLDLGLSFPGDFVRGLYESEGSIKWHRTSLELAIYSTNEPMLQRVSQLFHDRGYHPKWNERPLESGKTLVHLELYQSLEIRKLIAWIQPCIKYLPRTDVNAEPSQDGNDLEGVESTKASRPDVE
jgi:hypothetical protein